MDKFDFSQGFMVGASIPEWGEETIRTDIPPEIGALVFYKKTWGLDIGDQFEEIETRACTWDDFDHSFQDGQIGSFGDARTHNSDDTKANEPMFYPTRYNLEELQKIWHDFHCVANPEDLYINGNYDSNAGTSLMIVFETCEEEYLPEGIEKCASREEMREWMKWRFIVTLEN